LNARHTRSIEATIQASRTRTLVWIELYPGVLVGNAKYCFERAIAIEEKAEVFDILSLDLSPTGRFYTK
jgi:hypothetical protein